MHALKQAGAEFIYFIRVFSRYTHKRVRHAWIWFEGKKDLLVSFLVAKRGLYQRPFLHTSLFVLIGAGIVVMPLVNSNTAGADELSEFIPASAVLSSFDDQNTLTQESDKPRHEVLTYPVAEGDTISTIAEKFGVSADTIRWVNPTLKDDKLSIGMELLVPPVTGMVVKVAKGDTVYKLADKYKTDAQKIVNWPFNEFTDLDTFSLSAGQTLVIPDGVMPEAKPVYSPRTIAQVGATTGTGQFSWPTQGAITQNPVSYHMALDIANRTLPTIMAADAGTVTLVENGRYGYGRHIIIDHNNGYQTLYAHMSEIYVSAGQAVSRGSVIGKMGSTGRSTGPHLHFEVRKNGALFNPLSFLN